MSVSANELERCISLRQRTGAESAHCKSIKAKLSYHAEGMGCLTSGNYKDGVLVLNSNNGVLNLVLFSFQQLLALQLNEFFFQFWVLNTGLLT